MPLSLDWNTSNDDWRILEQRVRRLPFLQSFDYGQALEQFYGHTIRYGVIADDQKTPLGLCRIQEVGALRNLLHAVMCDRGPVWLGEHGTEADFENFLQSLTKTFPRRIGRKRRLIPEHTDRSNTIKNHGWRKVGEGYDTIWVDLMQDEKTLRGNLKKNWRGSLQKFEKSDVTIEWDETGQTLPWLLKHYEIDKMRRGYDGATPKFLRVLGKIFAQSQNILIGLAMHGGNCIGSVLVLKHGTSATYQIGWTSDEGRRHCAHHGLLWQVVMKLKANGAKDFDLGGINESASGVRKFKMAMGGDIVTLPGIYS